MATRRKNKDTVSDTLSITEEAQVSPEEVQQVLEELKNAPSPETQVETQEQSSTEQDNEDMDVHFQADATFNTEELDDKTSELWIKVKAEDVQITEDDKKFYIKSLLFDEPVQLLVSMCGGLARVTCRGLSVYELSLVTEAVGLYLSENPSFPDVCAASLFQQFRVGMQVVSVNDKKFPYLELAHAPNKRQEHARMIMEHAFTQLEDMPMVKYNMFIQAVNVFESKLARLHSAALSQTFWNPADIV